MKIILILLTACMISAQTNHEKIIELISLGEFSKATTQIEELMDRGNLSVYDKLNLEFQIERMERIRKDFKKTADDILKYVKNYYNEATLEDLSKWKNDGSLEFKVIDGEKKYFNRAHTNLFRVNKSAKEQKEKVEGVIKDGLDVFLENYVPEIVGEAKSDGKNLIHPETLKLKYKLIVDADVVPPGEIIRCWLPYPREGHSRQQNISLLNTSEEEFVIADNKNLQRTIYMQKEAKEGEKTLFSYELEYTAYNEFFSIDESKIKEYEHSDEYYKTYTSERAPHILFTDKIKKLSSEIIGNETNYYLKAKKIYKWINDNIPWAGAREYSTLENISDYCITNGWGDCGIQSLLFITLCRYNGIPAKWQSGWMLHPGEVNLHDWSEIYLEGYGWVPVDQSFKLIDSDDELVKWFFFGGIDAYHLIINDDYSQQLFPAKIYPRSETVDFQRGEVEWRGGNLYFDQWDYNMKVEYFEE